MKVDVCYYRHAHMQGIVNFINYYCFVRYLKGFMSGDECERDVCDQHFVNLDMLSALKKDWY